MKGRPSSWNSVTKTKVIRVPEEYADRLLELAHTWDNGEEADNNDALPGDPYELLRQYEMIKITSSEGADLKIIAPRHPPERKEYHCPDCGLMFHAADVVFDGHLYRFSVEEKKLVRI